RVHRGGALGTHTGRAAPRVLGLLLGLGSARGSSRQAVSGDRERKIRVRHPVAAAAHTGSASQSRSAAAGAWRTGARRSDAIVHGVSVFSPALLTATDVITFSGRVKRLLWKRLARSVGLGQILVGTL